ncbi:VOC family protein [Breznakia pachnodae]|uniref:PhnB protein n=1 Tax=Breznakia pachnodae TaxID=265178 RepID=A0ABU0E6V2_9FIRM|nr:VOC family protein [Breznakia pachnodae]MDQ0362638.1 PhnB protein [Breznakia pachnodae]
MIKSSTPFLLFDGNCQNALDLYVSVFHATIVEKMTFEEVGYTNNKDSLNYIANSTFKLGESIFYAGDIVDDGREQWQKGNQVSIWLELSDVDELMQIERQLLDTGGKSIIRTHETFWNSQYTKVQDKYGMIWELNVQL